MESLRAEASDSSLVVMVPLDSDLRGQAVSLETSQTGHHSFSFSIHSVDEYMKSDIENNMILE